MDIVKRLLAWLNYEPNDYIEPAIADIKEAADEIERLRQQVEDLALVARGAAYRIEDTKKSHRFLAMIDKTVGGK